MEPSINRKQTWLLAFKETNQNTRVSNEPSINSLSSSLFVSLFVVGSVLGFCFLVSVVFCSWFLGHLSSVLGFWDTSLLFSVPVYCVTYLLCPFLRHFSSLSFFVSVLYYVLVVVFFCVTSLRSPCFFCVSSVFGSCFLCQFCTMFLMLVSVLFCFPLCVSPWYDLRGWRGVKSQLSIYIYLSFLCQFCSLSLFFCVSSALGACFFVSVLYYVLAFCISSTLCSWFLCGNYVPCSCFCMSWIPTQFVL